MKPSLKAGCLWSSIVAAVVFLIVVVVVLASVFMFWDEIKATLWNIVNQYGDQLMEELLPKADKDKRQACFQGALRVLFQEHLKEGMAQVQKFREMKEATLKDQKVTPEELKQLLEEFNTMVLEGRAEKKTLQKVKAAVKTYFDGEVASASKTNQLLETYLEAFNQIAPLAASTPAAVSK